MVRNIRNPFFNPSTPLTHDEPVEINKSQAGLRFTNVAMQGVDIPVSNLIQRDNAFSLQVDFTPLGGSSSNSILLGQRGWNTGLIYQGNAQFVALTIWENVGGNHAERFLRTSLPHGTRARVTVTYNPSTRMGRIYLNGELMDSMVMSAEGNNWAGINQWLTIGGNDGANNWSVNGIKHSATAWNRELTPHEVKHNNNFVNRLFDYDFTNQDIHSTTVVSTTNRNHGTIRMIGGQPGVSYVQQDTVNLFDGDWEIGSFNNNGAPLNGNGEIRSVNLLPVIGGRIIFAWSPTATAHIVVFDENREHIAHHNNLHSTPFTLPINARYIRLRTGAGTNHDLSVIMTVTHDRRITTQMNHPRLRLNQSLHAPTLDFPFNFQRASTGFAEGRVFEPNQPRFMNGGIIVESAGENRLPSAVGGSHLQSQLIVDENGAEILLLDARVSGSNQWVNLWNPPVQLNGRTGWWTVSFEARGTALPSMNDMRGGGLSFVAPQWVNNPTLNENEFQRYVFRVNLPTHNNDGGEVTQFQFTRWFYGQTNQTDWIYFRELQVEASAFNSTFQPPGLSRAPEFFQLANIHQYFDEIGSITYEFTPMSGANINHNATRGLHDIVFFVGQDNGLMMRRNNNHTGAIQLNSRNSRGSGFHDFNPAFAWQNNQTLKYRIEWNRRQDYTRFYVNDTLLGQSGCFDMPPVNAIFSLGSRSGVSSNPSDGQANAIIGDFVIRDRWGRITFDIRQIRNTQEVE